MDLSERETLFVEAYLRDRNATRAAAAAGYNPDYGRRLRYKAEVAEAILAAQKARGERVGLTTDDVLEGLSRIASTDAGELVEHLRVNCRHCHGRDFRPQFTKAELFERHDAGADPIDPHNAGVFDPWRGPNIDCPQCGGLGESAVFLKDVRYMSPEGRTLYAGLRKRRDGFEFVTPDRIRALVQVGRCLGMFRRDDAGADGDTYEKLLDDLG